MYTIEDTFHSLCDPEYLKGTTPAGNLSTPQKTASLWPRVNRRWHAYCACMLAYCSACYNAYCACTLACYICMHVGLCILCMHIVMLHMPYLVYACWHARWHWCIVMIHVVTLHHSSKSCSLQLVNSCIWTRIYKEIYKAVYLEFTDCKPLVDAGILV